MMGECDGENVQAFEYFPQTPAIHRIVTIGCCNVPDMQIHSFRRISLNSWQPDRF